MYEIIKQTYQNLPDDIFLNGTIIIRDDSDGKGAYIEKWGLDTSEYPLPKGLKIGKNEEVI